MEKAESDFFFSTTTTAWFRTSRRLFSSVPRRFTTLTICLCKTRNKTSARCMHSLKAINICCFGPIRKNQMEKLRTENYKAKIQFWVAEFVSGQSNKFKSVSIKDQNWKNWAVVNFCERAWADYNLNRSKGNSVLHIKDCQQVLRSTAVICGKHRKSVMSSEGAVWSLLNVPEWCQLSQRQLGLKSFWSGFRPVCLPSAAAARKLPSDLRTKVSLTVFTDKHHYTESAASTVHCDSDYITGSPLGDNKYILSCYFEPVIKHLAIYTPSSCGASWFIWSPVCVCLMSNYSVCFLPTPKIEKSGP